MNEHLQYPDGQLMGIAGDAPAVFINRTAKYGRMTQVLEEIEIEGEKYYKLSIIRNGIRNNDTIFSLQGLKNLQTMVQYMLDRGE